METYRLTLILKGHLTRARLINVLISQVVWKGTTSVGVGVATSSQPDADDFYTSFVVARYSPPGNYEGQFSDNVKPL